MFIRQKYWFYVCKKMMQNILPDQIFRTWSKLLQINLRTHELVHDNKTQDQCL